jgi:hypothetical protein
MVLRKLILCFLLFTICNAQDIIVSPIVMGTTSAPRSNLLLDSLKAFWAFSEASGNALDSSGRSNTLTNNNTTPYLAGLIGNCVRTDSANNRNFSIASNADVQLGDKDWTLAVWIMAKQLGSGKAHTIMGKYAVGSYEYKLYLATNDRPQIMIYNGTSTSEVAYAQAGSAIADTTLWNLIIAYHDAAMDSIYIQVNNGTIAKRAETAAMGIGTTALYIGAKASGTDERFSGQIDMPQIWHRKLTAAERTLIYNSGAGIPYSSYR